MAISFDLRVCDTPTSRIGIDKLCRRELKPARAVEPCTTVSELQWWRVIFNRQITRKQIVSSTQFCSDYLNCGVGSFQSSIILAILPQTQFGFATSSVFATPGISGPLGSALPVVQASYQPSQSIFSSLGNRYSNATTVEAAYKYLDAIIRYAGGFLRTAAIRGARNIDTNDSIFSAGYDYALTKNDTVGILYRFTSYRFEGAPQSLQDHIAEWLMDVKLTGRISAQLFVGPEITVFRHSRQMSQIKAFRLREEPTSPIRCLGQVWPRVIATELLAAVEYSQAR